MRSCDGPLKRSSPCSYACSHCLRAALRVQIAAWLCCKLDQGVFGQFHEQGVVCSRCIVDFFVMQVPAYVPYTPVRMLISYMHSACALLWHAHTCGARVEAAYLFTRVDFFLGRRVS
jgi:hypothetical protein